MPSICAYPAKPWICDSSVAVATVQQGLPWILGSAALDSGSMSPAQAQNFSV